MDIEILLVLIITVEIYNNSLTARIGQFSQIFIEYYIFLIVALISTLA